MESPELREIRRFEQAAFPRAGSGPRRREATVTACCPRAHCLVSGEAVATFPRSCVRRRPSRPRSPPRRRTRSGCAGWRFPDLPVRWDAQVLRYLDYFKNDPKGHAIMAGWLRRSGRYRELFEKVLVREGLPKDLMYVAMVESGFDTGARSRVGAGGIWQFMPGAARAYGLEVSYWVDARRDPERAVDAAARYLKDLLRPVRILVPGVRRVQRRVRVRAAVNHVVQHERLLGADPARGGVALGIDAVRAEDPGSGDRGPQPGRVRFRGRDRRCTVRVRKGGRAAGDGAGDRRPRRRNEARGDRGPESGLDSRPHTTRPQHRRRPPAAGHGVDVRGELRQNARRRQGRDCRVALW